MRRLFPATPPPNKSPDPTADESVIEFVAEFTGVNRQRLSVTSTLLGDLGVDGADGWELIKAFGQKFQVDLSAFRADQHFGPEGLPVHAPFVWFRCLISWPFRKRQTPEKHAGLRAIQISDLIAAAKAKRWTL
jgi:acyl carrier protein